jgi:hypothetical protein
MATLKDYIKLCEDKKPLVEARGCQRCGSDKILGFSGKCSDLCFATYKGVEKDGYVPSGIGIDQNDGYGDYVQGDLCLACGQMQGKFPIPDKKIAEVFGKEVISNKSTKPRDTSGFRLRGDGTWEAIGKEVRSNKSTKQVMPRDQSQWDPGTFFKS